MFFLNAHCEASILAEELPEEPEQFRLWRSAHLANRKVSVGLNLGTSSVLRITIPVDLSTRSFIPQPHFFNSRRVPPLHNQSLVLFPQHLMYRYMNILSLTLTFFLF